MKDLIVFAENREEMVASQLQMVDWAVMKLENAKEELAEVTANLEQAVKGKMKASGWRKQQERANQKVQYYEKMHAALAAGYVIVPNFPIDIFAVRTSRKYPIQMYHRYVNDLGDKTDRTQEGEVLALGKGENVSDAPLVKRRSSGYHQEKPCSVRWADEYQAVDFPMKAIKPVILDRTSKALQLKVFDEIGILPARPQKRKALAPASAAITVPRGIDPMIIGRIKFKQAAGKDKVVSFVIAWWLKASDLEV